MISLSPIVPFLSLFLVGAALSADSEFDWGDPDDDYESPFADEDDDPFEGDESDLRETENPFASASDDETSPDDDHDETEEADSSSEPEETEEIVEEQEPLTTVAEARSLCETAMQALHEGDSDQAFDRLRAHWAFSPDEMSQLQDEVDRTRAVVGDRYGDALDHRLVREDTVDDVLVRFVYLERFERHGLRWQFTFYEGGEGWTLNDVYFDDEIEALLK